MPMTTEEDRISAMIGSKSARPIVGLSRTRSGVAFAFWHVEASHNQIRNLPVVIGVSEVSLKFDERSASWKPVPCEAGEAWPISAWTPADEADLERLRAM